MNAVQGAGIEAGGEQGLLRGEDVGSLHEGASNQQDSAGDG